MNTRCQRIMLASCGGLVALFFGWPIVATASSTNSTASVSFRAVLCFAPALAVAAPPTIEPLPTCGSSYRLTAKNLDVNPLQGTYRTISPDPVFRNTPSSSSTQNRLSTDVILPGVNGDNTVERYVLGPARMTSSAIKSATVEKLSGQWAVSYQLTPSGSEVWNSFARQQFHELIAIVANGRVYSSPIIQPDSTHFTSFGATGLITGNFTAAEARRLANYMLGAVNSS